MSTLVIVESPAKAKTIKKYLGKSHEVMASYGHVRDLRPKEGAVDPENDFAMVYELIERNSKHVDNFVKAARKADTILLAPDPDREGEAIAWHVQEILKTKRGFDKKEIKRVVFNEITKKAIQDAVANPRDISFDLVNAQQARRALDYLVGFKLSPLLWKKIRRGLSAGRVQSPALRLIVERELEIEAFKPKEYWSIEADVNAEKQDFIGRLVEYQNKKVEQFTVTKDKQANDIRDELLQAANGKLTVSNVEKKQRKRNPAPPFITSTLQQEAARKLGYTAQRTMRIAQQLYEGIDTGDGAVGLITYMRTDSVHLAQEAVDEIRDLITERYGKEQLPADVRVFKTKSKNAQEAHEAIRPTSSHRTPENIKAFLTDEQHKLYNLIWKRAVACQMIHATVNTVAIDFACGEGNRFRSNGSSIANPGFLSVYQEGQDDTKASDSDEKFLPDLKKDDIVDLKEIRADQHFTEPPPRYSEASLIKMLEELGIGRPSTYATIIHTLLNREYVVLDKKRFSPTDVGRIVAKFLTNYFTQYVDYEFTANLENTLDDIANGDQEWIAVLKKFWSPFINLIKETETNVQRSDVTQEVIDEKCPDCGSDLSKRLGKHGIFISCTNYPDCKYARNMDGNSSEPEIVEDRKCPKCEKDLVIKVGRYGKFIGCSSYPDCKHIEPLVKPRDTEVKCPQCKKENILERRSKRGKIFFSCAGYPTCKYAIWNEPVDEKCPKCAWPILSIKETKKRGREKVCPQKECDFIENLDEAE